jgi:hypothetical protein
MVWMAAAHPGIAVAAILLNVLVGTVGLAQQANLPQHRLSPELRNQCAMCHTCTAPTKSNPCLITCPRVKESTGIYTPADGPGVVLMNKMTGQYGPVVFGHRSHAQMAEMSGGCNGCHHYNDTSLKILPCKTCHPAERKRQNIDIPDLKAAYHRQCLACHRQWNGSPECSTCHLEKADGKTPEQILEGYTRGRKDHPPVPAPEKRVYTTKEQDGTVVTFFHGDHSKRFGLKCLDCHRNDGCITCHDKRPEKVRKAEEITGAVSFESRHARCSSCHEGDNCDKCHLATEQNAFDHARSSGWALRPYHAALACTACHRAPGKFQGLKHDCIGCHTTFEAGKFNHGVTGLTLDDTHASFDCVECHAGRAFDKPPACSGCHPDKSYPAFTPGKVSHK